MTSNDAGDNPSADFYDTLSSATDCDDDNDLSHLHLAKLTSNNSKYTFLGCFRTNMVDRLFFDNSPHLYDHPSDSLTIIAQRMSNCDFLNFDPNITPDIWRVILTYVTTKEKCYFALVKCESEKRLIIPIIVGYLEGILIVFFLLISAIHDKTHSSSNMSLLFSVKKRLLNEIIFYTTIVYCICIFIHLIGIIIVCCTNFNSSMINKFAKTKVRVYNKLSLASTTNTQDGSKGKGKSKDSVRGGGDADGDSYDGINSAGAVSSTIDMIDPDAFDSEMQPNIKRMKTNDGDDDDRDDHGSGDGKRKITNKLGDHDSNENDCYDYLINNTDFLLDVFDFPLNYSILLKTKQFCNIWELYIPFQQWTNMLQIQILSSLYNKPFSTKLNLVVRVVLTKYCSLIVVLYFPFKVLWDWRLTYNETIEIAIAFCIFFAIVIGFSWILVERWKWGINDSSSYVSEHIRRKLTIGMIVLMIVSLSFGYNQGLLYVWMLISIHNYYLVLQTLFQSLSKRIKGSWVDRSGHARPKLAYLNLSFNDPDGWMNGRCGQFFRCFFSFWLPCVPLQFKNANSGKFANHSVVIHSI